MNWYEAMASWGGNPEMWKDIGFAVIHQPENIFHIRDFITRRKVEFFSSFIYKSMVWKASKHPRLPTKIETNGNSTAKREFENDAKSTAHNSAE